MRPRTVAAIRSKRETNRQTCGRSGFGRSVQVSVQVLRGPFRFRSGFGRSVQVLEGRSGFRSGFGRVRSGFVRAVQPPFVGAYGATDAILNEPG